MIWVKIYPPQVEGCIFGNDYQKKRRVVEYLQVDYLRQQVTRNVERVPGRAEETFAHAMVRVIPVDRADLRSEI
jgi:hypothetical protein